jgi:ribosome assembly protein RRB1
MDSSKKRRAEEGPTLDESIVTAGMKDLVFADPYEDVIEDEEDSGSESDDADGSDDDDGGDTSAARAGAGGPSVKSSADTRADPKRVWRPGVDSLGEGEALDYDPSAYVMLHHLAVEWPCLSFDVVPDRCVRKCVN